MLLISIILPTYERAHFIEKAINAISQQTYSCWELIIIDDGSTDNTEELVKELSVNIKNEIKYLKQENKGPAVARNTGIKKAKGDYVAFFDSDDLWLPHHLFDCIEVLNNNKDVSWVYGDFKLFN
jgi:glycosyltransferase involved in cell wall biosynthesis